MNLTLYRYQVYLWCNRKRPMNLTLYLYGVHSMIQQEAINEFDVVSLRRSFYNTAGSDQWIWRRIVTKFIIYDASGIDQRIWRCIFTTFILWYNRKRQMNLAPYLYDVHLCYNMKRPMNLTPSLYDVHSMIQHEAINEFDTVSLRRSFYDTTWSDQWIWRCIFTTFILWYNMKRPTNLTLYLYDVHLWCNRKRRTNLTPCRYDVNLWWNRKQPTNMTPYLYDVHLWCNRKRPTNLTLYRYDVHLWCNRKWLNKFDTVAAWWIQLYICHCEKHVC